MFNVTTLSPLNIYYLTKRIQIFGPADIFTPDKIISEICYSTEKKPSPIVNYSFAHSLINTRTNLNICSSCRHEFLVYVRSFTSHSSNIWMELTGAITNLKEKKEVKPNCTYSILSNLLSNINLTSGHKLWWRISMTY